MQVCCTVSRASPQSVRFRITADLAPPRLRIGPWSFDLRAPLDNLFSFYAHSLPGALKSLANLFFHYKSCPAFYTPPRTPLLFLDIAARTRRAGFLSRSLSGPSQSTHPKTP